MDFLLITYFIIKGRLVLKISWMSVFWDMTMCLFIIDSGKIPGKIPSLYKHTSMDQNFNYIFGTTFRNKCC